MWCFHCFFFHSFLLGGLILSITFPSQCPHLDSLSFFSFPHTLSHYLLDNLKGCIHLCRSHWIMIIMINNYDSQHHFLSLDFCRILCSPVANLVLHFSMRLFTFHSVHPSRSRPWLVAWLASWPVSSVREAASAAASPLYRPLHSVEDCLLCSGLVDCHKLWILDWTFLVQKDSAILNNLLSIKRRTHLYLLCLLSLL